MNEINHAVKFASDYLTATSKKRAFKHGLESFITLRDALDVVVKRHEKLNEAFVDVGYKNLWVDCPDCDSPVLLEMESCPFCTANLLGARTEEDVEETLEADAVEEDIEEVTAQAVTEELEEEELTLSDDDIEDAEYKELSSNNVSEASESEEEDIPSEDAVNAMKRPELVALIKEFDLDVEVKGVKVGDLREKVNDALDLLAEEQDEEYGEETESDDADDVNGELDNDLEDADIDFESISLEDYDDDDYE